MRCKYVASFLLLLLTFEFDRTDDKGWKVSRKFIYFFRFSIFLGDLGASITPSPNGGSILRGSRQAMLRIYNVFQISRQLGIRIRVIYSFFVSFSTVFIFSYFSWIFSWTSSGLMNPSTSFNSRCASSGVFNYVDLRATDMSSWPPWRKFQAFDEGKVVDRQVDLLSGFVDLAVETAPFVFHASHLVFQLGLVTVVFRHLWPPLYLMGRAGKLADAHFQQLDGFLKLEKRLRSDAGSGQ